MDVGCNVKFLVSFAGGEVVKRRFLKSIVVGALAYLKIEVLASFQLCSFGNPLGGGGDHGFWRDSVSNIHTVPTTE